MSTTLIATVLYDLLLAPFVIPGVMALARRTATQPALVRAAGLVRSMCTDARVIAQRNASTCVDVDQPMPMPRDRPRTNEQENQ